MKIMFKALASAIAVATAVATVVVGVSAIPQSASAVSGSQFDPGYIISDSAFFDASSMSEQQIQQFLQQMVPSCAGAAGQPCLKDYIEATISRAPVATNHCGPYAGSPGERASTIIFKVAQACNISPKVLLATLQKERGLITKVSPTVSDYRVAMGFGCPDTAPCATEYYGFGNQMYLAARQFRQYTFRPTSYKYRVGVVNVQFHPNAACGSTPVNIRNQATANLYNYTPYQPNRAALANLNGSGDGCSSYGNRNFWNYFYSWFGNPAFSEDPRASLDESSVATTGDAAFIRLRGWAFDPAAPASSMAVHIYVTRPDGSTAGYPIVATGNRPDVAAAYPGAGAAHGFTFEAKVEATGSYKSCVYLIRAAGPVLFGCQFFVVTQDAPTGNLESAAVNLSAVPGSLDVRGWAIDDIKPTRPTNVHLYLQGPGGTVSTYVVPANQSRPDVGSAFPLAGANHGFSYSIPLRAQGQYRLCAYAIGTPIAGANNQTIGCSSVVFGPSLPLGAADSITPSGTSGARSVTVTGWALDNAARAASTEAHVYITAPDGRTTGTALTAAVPRLDVAQAYPGAGAPHGYSSTIPVGADGVYKVCIYAIGAATFGPANSLIRCSDVSVGVGKPRGSLDSIATSAGQIVARGWALDEAAPAAQTEVHFYTTSPSGVRRGYVVIARDPRPDVGAAVRGAGPNHGFTLTMPRSEPGVYSVCGYAISDRSVGSGNVLLGCSTV